MADIPASARKRRNHPHCCEQTTPILQDRSSQAMTERTVGYTSIRLLSMWTSFLSPTVHWKRETAPAGFVKILSCCRLCFFFPVILQHLLFSFQQDRLWPSLKVLEGVCLFVHFRCKMVTFLSFIQLPLTLCIKAVLCSGWEVVEAGGHLGV